MADRWTRLADLAVHGANVQPGQIVMVSVELGQEELARAVAASSYGRGAKFVDVVYFDPHLKRARVENADPETLDYVPDWYGERLLTLADGHGARIALSGPTEPNLMNDLDKTLVGRDRLPWLKETSKVIGDRTTNWTIVPCPNDRWAELVHPDLPAAEAHEKLWSELEHVLRLDEPDPAAAWDERMDALNTSAARLAERRFDAIELRGPGTELTVGLLPLMQEHGGAVVTLDFDNSTQAWPSYDWMGVSKAALESIVRYLARDLGKYQIRVNALGAGPLSTIAAKGVPGFKQVEDSWDKRAPLGWDSKSAFKVAGTACAMLSDYMAATTGELIHVDGGYHAIGAESPND